MESHLHGTAAREYKAETPVRSAITVRVGLIVLACLILLLAFIWFDRARKSSVNSRRASDSTQVSNDELKRRDSPLHPQIQLDFDSTLSHPSGSGQTARKTDPLSPPKPTAESLRLIANLVRWQGPGGELTPDAATAWKQNLQNLISLGPAGVAAIQEFLAENQEYDFGQGSKDMLGYSSARKAMFAALTQIGGPEAIQTMTGVLQTTADPGEIALLAQDLEKLEPGQHLQQVLDAARQTLQMAGSQKLEMPDTAPLFEVLQKYGGSAVVTDLERASGQWNYYSTIALAQLPDGAGIPSLVQLAQDPKSPGNVRDAAVQMLAQVCDRSAEARGALVTLVQQNQMSVFTWQMVASGLAGDQVGLLNSAFEDHQALSQMSGLRTVATSDHQNYFALPGSLTPEQANERLALINELLAGNIDPMARQLLQQSSALLKNRLSPPPLAVSSQ